MSDPDVHYFPARDGEQLAYRELGAGRPLILIHGYFSTGYVNWIRYGHAELIAEYGFRVIMPDLRAHGESAKPHDAAGYPPDVLADDGLALIDHLELTDYDLGGYSLGARTTLRMLLRGATPGRAIVAGIGLAGMTSTGTGGSHFREVLTHPGTFEHGSAEWRAEAFLKTVGGDPVALLHILDTWTDTPAEELSRIEVPTLVVVGSSDTDHASAEDLAALLPHGQYLSIPGDHMSVVSRPDLGAAIAEFLDGSPL